MSEPTTTDTRSGIVAAAAHLLRTSGAKAVTTRAVAQEAGVPPPTIFRLFGDKDGLLEAVAEHVLADYVATKAARAAEENGDPVEDLRAAWRAHIAFNLANPDVFLLLVAPGRLRNSSATSDGAEVLRARVARVAAARLLKVSEARAVDMIHAAGDRRRVRAAGATRGPSRSGPRHRAAGRGSRRDPDLDVRPARLRAHRSRRGAAGRAARVPGAQRG